MENSNNYQINSQAQGTSKIVGIGCGALAGICFCTSLSLIPLTFRPLISGLDPFLIEIPPLLVTVIILTAITMGAVLGGIGGYFLFFNLADSNNRKMAQQQAFERAVEKAVEKKLHERENWN